MNSVSIIQILIINSLHKPNACLQSHHMKIAFVVLCSLDNVCASPPIDTMNIVLLKKKKKKKTNKTIIDQILELKGQDLKYKDTKVQA